MRLQTAPTSSAARTIFPAYCLATDAVGDAVYVTDNKIGDHYQVTKVNIDSIPTVPAVGIIIRKRNTTDCEVQVGGIVRDVYTGLTPQRPLFVGVDGRLTHIVTPRPVSGRRAQQMMGQALSTTDLLLNVKSPIILVG